MNVEIGAGLRAIFGLEGRMCFAAPSFALNRVTFLLAQPVEKSIDSDKWIYYVWSNASVWLEVCNEDGRDALLNQE